MHDPHFHLVVVQDFLQKIPPLYNLVEICNNLNQLLVSVVEISIDHGCFIIFKGSANLQNGGVMFRVQQIDRIWNLNHGSKHYWFSVVKFWGILRAVFLNRASQLGRAHTVQDEGHTHCRTRADKEHVTLSFSSLCICFFILENYHLTVSEMNSGAEKILKRN